MAVDPRKRQKKKSSAEAKRKLKRHQLVKAKNVGVGEHLALAAKYPVIDSWVTTDLWDQGMGYVCLARELPNGSVGFTLFLVDRFCLGVKNALAAIKSRFELDTQLRQIRSQFTVTEVSPATARKFVESAVAYAQSLGFPPHPDYQKAKFIFGDINPAEATEELEFGKDGKPFFISGPHDTPQRCKRIMATLARNAGPGKFDAIFHLGKGLSLLPHDPQSESMELLDPEVDEDLDGEEVGLSEDEDAVERED